MLGDLTGINIQTPGLQGHHLTLEEVTEPAASTSRYLGRALLDPKQDENLKKEDGLCNESPRSH